jgi:DNA-binding HxlR family transcriptional regulator
LHDDSSGDAEFDASRAELFEALGHHTRIGILQALAEKPMAFAELKRRTGIESSGLLSFHMGKLTHLVVPTPEGTYALTDQGKEAVRMIQITKSEGKEQTIRVRSRGRTPYLAAIAVLLVLLLALGTYAVIQQQQIGTLRGRGTGSAAPNTLVYGTLTSPSWASGMTVVSSASTITFTSTAGMPYSAHPNGLGQYWTSLPGGDNYTVTVSWKTTLQCASCYVIGNVTFAGSVSAAGNATVTTYPRGSSGTPGCVPSGCFAWVELSAVGPGPNTLTLSGRCTGFVLTLTRADVRNYNLSC